MTDNQFPTLATVLRDHLPPGVHTDWIAAAIYAWDRACLIKTPEDLHRVPTRAIVWSAAGTIACRFDDHNGVVFGDDRPFPWDRLALPARLIWHPEWRA